MSKIFWDALDANMGNPGFWFGCIFAATVWFVGLTMGPKDDSLRPWQWAFQIPSSTQMEGLYDLYLDVMMVLVAVGIFVFYLFERGVRTWYFSEIAWLRGWGAEANPDWRTVQNRIITGDAIYARLAVFRPAVFYSHMAVVEFLWTILPCVLLLLIAIPSFTLVLALDEDFRPWFWVKVIGNQWFWTYECSTLSTKTAVVAFESVMVNDADLKDKYLRLLAVDNSLTIPFNKPTRFLVTANDVIHSWAVPSLGVKIDACPGRINSVTVIPKRAGIFYGQCSEICGVNHAFMPIVVEVVS